MVACKFIIFYSIIITYHVRALFPTYHDTSTHKEMHRNTYTYTALLCHKGERDLHGNISAGSVVEDCYIGDMPACKQ